MRGASWCVGLEHAAEEERQTGSVHSVVVWFLVSFLENCATLALAKLYQGLHLNYHKDSVYSLLPGPYVESCLYVAIYQFSTSPRVPSLMQSQIMLEISFFGRI